jgi:hypothetical protein
MLLLRQFFPPCILTFLANATAALETVIGKSCYHTNFKSIIPCQAVPISINYECIIV